VILELDDGNGDAKAIAGWDWNGLIEPDAGSVRVNAFDSRRSMVDAVTLTQTRDERMARIFAPHEPEVICDVTLSHGRTVRGMFSNVDVAVPRGWASLTLDDGGDERKPERWLHINPAHVVTVEVVQEP
jgi:hypothetical protein